MRRILPLLTVLLMGFAPAPFPKPDTSKVDLEKLQGEWVCTHLVVEGQTRHPGGDTIDFTESLVTTSFGFQFTITLDTTKRVKAMDWKSAVQLFEHIYHLDGDTLLLCRGDDRPTDFNGSKHGRVLEVYKRKKRPSPQL